MLYFRRVEEGGRVQPLSLYLNFRRLLGALIEVGYPKPSLQKGVPDLKILVGNALVRAYPTSFGNEVVKIPRAELDKILAAKAREMSRVTA